eukprot:TRINITY_DN62957_c1_g1_i1.p1 TRINITY_DN62957_c1_g1~~TRINITY_DN62957_c1_g1_i1.p1  ORF type:complete len:853 (-),score=198.14 TRINITY_DN62957_c1_g1_i1:132-2690(-)
MHVSSIGRASSPSCSHAEFQCGICLDLAYKPVVNVCGHTFCFWCLCHSMNNLEASNCPTCRREYDSFPAVCSWLHFWLQRAFPEEYAARAHDEIEQIKQYGEAGLALSKGASPKVPPPPGWSASAVGDIFDCMICHKLLVQPVVLPACGHVVCRNCIPTWNKEIFLSIKSPLAQAVLMLQKKTTTDKQQQDTTTNDEKNNNLNNNHQTDNNNKEEEDDTNHPPPSSSSEEEQTSTADHHHHHHHGNGDDANTLSSLSSSAATVTVTGEESPKEEEASGSGDDGSGSGDGCDSHSQDHCGLNEQTVQFHLPGQRKGSTQGIIQPQLGCCPACSQHIDVVPDTCIYIANVIKHSFKYSYAAREALAVHNLSVENVKCRHDKTRKAPPRSTESTLHIYTTTNMNGLSISGSSFVWFGTGCDGCGLFPLTGQRYQCTQCAPITFDLCEKCYHHQQKQQGQDSLPSSSTTPSSSSVDDDGQQQQQPHNEDSSSSAATFCGRFGQAHDPSSHTLRRAAQIPDVRHMLRHLNPELSLTQIIDMLSETPTTTNNNNNNRNQTTSPSPPPAAAAGVATQTNHDEETQIGVRSTASQATGHQPTQAALDDREGGENNNQNHLTPEQVQAQAQARVHLQEMEELERRLEDEKRALEAEVRRREAELTRKFELARELEQRSHALEQQVRANAQALEDRQREKIKLEEDRLAKINHARQLEAKMEAKLKELEERHANNAHLQRIKEQLLHEKEVLEQHLAANYRTIQQIHEASSSSSSTTAHSDDGSTPPVDTTTTTTTQPSSPVTATTTTTTVTTDTTNGLSSSTDDEPHSFSSSTTPATDEPLSPSSTTPQNMATESPQAGSP